MNPWPSRALATISRPMFGIRLMDMLTTVMGHAPTGLATIVNSKFGQVDIVSFLLEFFIVAETRLQLPQGRDGDRLSKCFGLETKLWIERLLGYGLGRRKFHASCKR
jgi:hypothetical protein